MKITNEGRLGFGSLIANLGGDPDLPEGEAPHDCCDPTPPPDRALDAPAFVPSTPATDIPIVQIAEEGATNATRVLATPGTVGNTLIGIVFDRDFGGSGVEMPPLGGWTEIATGADTIANDRACTMLYHVVTSDETPYTVGGDGVSYPLTPSSNQHTLMIELDGTYDSIFNDDDSVASTTAMNAGGPVTPGTGDTVFILGAAVIYTNVGGVTEYPDVASLRDEWNGFSPYNWAGYMIVDNASGAYTVGGTMAASHYAGVTAVFTITAPSLPAWDIPAPNTVDGDDATYHEIEGPDVLRVDLGGLFRIVRARLLMGSEDAGNVMYRIRGATEADFSDAVELVAKTFDVTGSFTADDVEFLWSTAESYRYFELSGTNETRRVYSFELYEPSIALGEDHNHDAIQGQIDDLAESLTAHVDEILTHGTAETDDSLVLAPDGAGGVEFRAETGGGGGSGISSGTSNPGSPSDGDLFYRSDLDLLIRYRSSGTRWVCTCPHEGHFGVIQAFPGTTTSGSIIGRLAPLHTTFNLWLETLYSTIFVITTNNGTNFWTVTASKEHAGLTTIATFTTAAQAANVWLTRATAINAVYTGVTDGEFEIVANKTLSPGGIYWGTFVMTYRRIVP